MSEEHKPLTNDSYRDVDKAGEHNQRITGKYLIAENVRSAVMYVLSRIQDEGTERADVILLEGFPVFFDDCNGTYEEVSEDE